MLVLLWAFASLAAASSQRFSAVWNCPYLGGEVLGNYGLSANKEGSFNGSVITLFYGPDSWPRLKATPNPAINPCWTGKMPCTWNQTEIWRNITVEANGGVPQAGDIDAHRAAVAAIVQEQIPDPHWAGYGIFDWESWRVLYRQNDDALSYNTHYSELLVQQQHPSWTNATKISAEAERQYNAGARLFFTETLRTAKRLRPNGRFGFYQYPISGLPELTWLWSEVGVMAGSQYLRSNVSTASSVNASISAVSMAEAAAKSLGEPFVRPDILTYIWLWPGAKPVTMQQLIASVRVPAAMGADGVVIWGSSGDAHVSGYESSITDFLGATVGPLIQELSLIHI
eukprot:TRINITY_DN49510_c0_g1_i1.p1 TRINITY_DN49510_c0_g1~~TRINITY_DN49510_c0_g1_i1.p1  ORF type:complete len:341 (-),score=43.97 TRINITY_DN49510_c0_g1_i1:159-1181(-)